MAARAVSPTWLGLVLVSLSVTAYAGFVARDGGRCASRTSRRLETAWLIGLLIAATGVQVMIPMGAPEGYDLAKWAAVNYVSGSTGYFQIARQQAVRDPWRFLAEYPEWIAVRIRCTLARTAGFDRRSVLVDAHHGATPGSGGFPVGSDAFDCRTGVPRVRRL